MSEIKGKYAPIMAVLVLMAFGLSIIYLTKHIVDTELQWTRLIYIFGGVEAIAFSAAGFIFGKEVHREQAANAENRADQAEGVLEGAQEKVKAAYGDKVIAERKLSDLTALIEVKRDSMSAAKSQNHESLAMQSDDQTQGQADKGHSKRGQPPANIDAANIALDELVRYARKLHSE